MFADRAPNALQPYIAQLLLSNKLTEDQRKDLIAMQAPQSWEKMEEAAGRYGLSLEKLGKGFQQLKGNDAFDQLFSDWTTFQDAGVQVGDAMDAMSAKVSEALNRARKFGTDVPEYMRPMLESMLAAGKVIDENGNALTDLGGIHFSDSIESSMDRIADILAEIRDALLGFGPAAKKGADGIRAAFSGVNDPRMGGGGWEDRSSVRYPWDDGEESSPWNTQWDAFRESQSHWGEYDPRMLSQPTEFARGGIVTKPTLGLVGEAGPEAIVPLDKLKGGVTINITAWDGESVNSWIRRGGSRVIAEAALRAFEENDSGGVPVSYQQRLQSVVGV
jgi:hypothetical protein